MNNQTSKNNICCRVFKEQLDLINQLPEKDRALVLYQAINNAFNQFDYQNENQIENQNDYAYVSESVSVSGISLSVLNLLSKNIVCKEFSNNYGGKRQNSGRKPTLNGTDKGGDKGTHKQKDNTIKEKNNIFIKPTLEEVENYIKEKQLSVDAKRFYDYYEAGDWKDSRGNKVKNWKQKMLANWVKEEPQKQKEEEYKYWL